MLAGAVQIRRAGTNIQTRKPTIALLTTGLDRFTRNSVYLGMTVGYVGLCLLADGLLALGVPPLALIFVRFGVIERGERYWRSKFGEAYRGCRGRDQQVDLNVGFESPRG